MWKTTRAVSVTKPSERTKEWRRQINDLMTAYNNNDNY